MVEIKSLFSDWHEVSEEQAIKYAKFLINNITTMRGDKLYDYINERHIRGIDVKELLKENNNG